MDKQHGMLAFKSLTHYKKGLLASFLRQCYAGLLMEDPFCWGEEEEKWLQFDNDVFNNLETIGRCVFITCFKEIEIGFASFDPRQRPELGIIGHNCVLPHFQDRGFGRWQIMEILEYFKQTGIRRANVVTSCHPFFAPARKMYIRCGFCETGRMIGGPDQRYELVDYEIRL